MKRIVPTMEVANVEAPQDLANIAAA